MGDSLVGAVRGLTGADGHTARFRELSGQGVHLLRRSGRYAELDTLSTYFLGLRS
ncbi:hypothetical protein GCM10010394_03770 [Streptomyces crystallinus]|uniref:Uncharacterized protein n=1 Tax=Streptomyces crystallinus TaxID=68191 RepID=A0ABP3PXX1_9ACTN